MSSKSAAHISEILGIAPSLSTPSSALTSGNHTPQDVEPPSDTFEIDKITTSAQSVHDYFTDKLKTKKFVHPSPRTLDDTDISDSRETRGGLGSSSRTVSVFGSSISSPYVVEVSAATPVAKKAEKKRKKKSKVMNEHQDNWSKKNAFPNDKKGRETIEGENHHSGRPLANKNATTDEESASNLPVKKKKKESQ